MDEVDELHELSRFAAPDGVGAVAIALVTPAGHVHATHGWIDDAGNPPTADALFPVGSITKGFAGLLLARLVLAGHIRLEDRIDRYWPHLSSMPAGSLTVLQLATHTAGLSRRPPSSEGNPPEDPYRGITTATVLDDLASVPVEPGPHEYSYSNFGYAVLGQLLQLAAGDDFETVLRREVLEPLACDGALFENAAGATTPVATPLGRSGQPVPRWEVQGLVGATGLMASADTMARFITAMCEAGEAGGAGIGGAVTLATTPFAEEPSTDGNRREIGLGWRLLTWAGTKIVWHNGHGRGNHSFVAIAPEHRAGIAVLTNHHHPTQLDLHALRCLRQAVQRDRNS